MSAEPHNLPDDVRRSGTALVLVPLIIGAAVVISLVLLFEARERRAQIAETARLEEEVRADLRAAYYELRDMRPEAALAITDAVRDKIALLKSEWVTDYLDIKAARFLMEGEALFRLDSTANIAAAEAAFDNALAIMTHASGEFWLYGMLGRGRTRYQMGDYAGAVEDFTMLLDRNSGFGTAYYYRSLARRRLGDDDAALRDEETAKALDAWPPLRNFVLASEEDALPHLFQYKRPR